LSQKTLFYATDPNILFSTLPQPSFNAPWLGFPHKRELGTCSPQCATELVAGRRGGRPRGAHQHRDREAGAKAAEWGSADSPAAAMACRGITISHCRQLQSIHPTYLGTHGGGDTPDIICTTGQS